MSNIISISLTGEEIVQLQKIKHDDGIGASAVMRIGISHIMNKPKLQASQFELQQKNEKLYKIILQLQKRVQELETVDLKTEG